MKKLLWLLFLLAAPLYAISLDSVATPLHSTGEVASLTVTGHVLGGCANRVVIGGVSHISTGGTHSITVTYNGGSMTADGSGTASNRGAGVLSGTMFYIKEASLPGAGTYSMVITSASFNSRIGADIISFCGVDQTTVWNNNNYTTGSSSAPSNTVTSANGNLAIGVVATTGSGASSVNGGETLGWSDTSASSPDVGSALSYESATASTNLLWSLFSSSAWKFSAQNLISVGGRRRDHVS